MVPMSISLPARVRRRLDGHMAVERGRLPRHDRRAVELRAHRARAGPPTRPARRAPRAGDRCGTRSHARPARAGHRRRDRLHGHRIREAGRRPTRPSTGRSGRPPLFGSNAPSRADPRPFAAGIVESTSRILTASPAGDDPEEAVVRRDERLTLLEFAATLSPREREVLACKYGTGPAVLGRKLVSRCARPPDRRGAQGRTRDRPEARALRDACRCRLAVQLPRRRDRLPRRRDGFGRGSGGGSASPPPLPRVPRKLRGARPRDPHRRAPARARGSASDPGRRPARPGPAACAAW